MAVSHSLDELVTWAEEALEQTFFIGDTDPCTAGVDNSAEADFEGCFNEIGEVFAEATITNLSSKSTEADFESCCDGNIKDQLGDFESCCCCGKKGGTPPELVPEQDSEGEGVSRSKSTPPGAAAAAAQACDYVFVHISLIDDSSCFPQLCQLSPLGTMRYHEHQPVGVRVHSGEG